MPHVVVLRLSTDEIGLLTRCIDATLSRLDDSEIVAEIGDTRRNLRRFARLLDARRANARHNPRAANRRVASPPGTSEPSG
jgi:hypothetical protein